MNKDILTRWLAGFALVAVLLSLVAGTAGAALRSPAKATLEKIGFDRDRLANEALSAAKSKGMTEVIVTLVQPDPDPAAAGANDAQRQDAFRARNNAASGDVISRLTSSEFRERNRFDNFAGFAGMASEAGIKKLLADPAVKYVEPMRILEAHLAQGIPLMNASTVRSTYNGSGLAVAICDTGIDYTHPKLGGGGFPNSKVLGGYDYGDSDADPLPNTQAHGTCCAGIVAGGTGTTGDYIGGVAYNAKLYALKISSGTTGSATSTAMVSAWDWCVTHKNDNPSYPIMVISTSFGGGRYYSNAEGDAASPGMTTAAGNAVAAGITVLASSGNDGYCDSMGWPAAITNVISVGAVYDANFGAYYPCVNAASCATKIADSGCATGYYVNDATAADKVTAYSNSASFLTLFAPANACYTTDIVGASGYNTTGDYHSSFGGTSAACPYAAGAVACLQSASQAILGRWLTVAEVRSKLLATGVNVTDGKVAITKPRVNLGAAIDSLYAVNSFTWNTVASPQSAGTPFGVTITARDGAGATATGFTGTANLSGLIPGPVATIGAGSSSDIFPMGTWYEDERTQVIYLASEIGGPMVINTLALNVAVTPGQTMNVWTIRMKHTPLASYSTANWESSGWTTVYQANENVTSTGWVQFDLSTPFSYNGTDNLMIDFSFNNASYTSDGECLYSAPGGNRTLYHQTDSGWGDPLTWSGTSSPTGTLSTNVPDIKLGSDDTPIIISPIVTGNFVGGVWTGNVTVVGPATGMLLRADDGSGHKGDSNTFNVTVADVTPPTGTIVINSDKLATKSYNVALSLTWDDGPTGSGVGRMRFSDDGSTWTPWESLAYTRVYTLPGPDGYKTVRVQYMDKALNKSAVYSDFIRLDTVAPTGTILINGGASTTTSLNVALNLTWADVGGGVTRMRFSDNGSTWTPWEGLRYTKTHTLPAGLGYHTVRVQYTDVAGNYSLIYNDYIKVVAP